MHPRHRQQELIPVQIVQIVVMPQLLVTWERLTQQHQPACVSPILAVPLEKKITQMFGGKKFIYCADAGLNSIDIRLFNSMGGRSFIVTQSVKKLSDVLQNAVFNDYDYRLLSDGTPVTVSSLKEFDRMNKENRSLYQDRAFKLLTADRAVDVGLTEVKICKNGKKKTVKSRAMLKQTIIITFSRKMLEYQRHIRNNQIQRAKILLKDIDPETYKKGPQPAIGQNLYLIFCSIRIFSATVFPGIL